MRDPRAPRGRPRRAGCPHRQRGQALQPVEGGALRRAARGPARRGRARRAAGVGAGRGRRARALAARPRGGRARAAERRDARPRAARPPRPPVLAALPARHARGHGGLGLVVRVPLRPARVAGPARRAPPPRRGGDGRARDRRRRGGRVVDRRGAARAPVADRRRAPARRAAGDPQRPHGRVDRRGGRARPPARGRPPRHERPARHAARARGPRGRAADHARDAARVREVHRRSRALRRGAARLGAAGRRERVRPLARRGRRALAPAAARALRRGRALRARPAPVPRGRPRRRPRALPRGAPARPLELDLQAPGLVLRGRLPGRDRALRGQLGQGRPGLRPGGLLPASGSVGRGWHPALAGNPWRMRIRRLAWIAIAAQPVFAVSWIVAGALEPGYSGARSTVSALAAQGAEHPWIVMAGLAALGGGVLALAAGLAMALPSRVASRVTVALFALLGCALIVAAFVRVGCDPAVRRCDGGAHGVAAGLAMLALLAAPFALGWALVPGRLGVYALLAGALGLGVMFVADPPPDGTAERLDLAWAQLWFVLVAIGLLRSRP